MSPEADSVALAWKWLAKGVHERVTLCPHLLLNSPVCTLQTARLSNVLGSGRCWLSNGSSVGGDVGLRGGGDGSRRRCTNGSRHEASSTGSDSGETCCVVEHDCLCCFLRYDVCVTRESCGESIGI